MLSQVSESRPGAPGTNLSAYMESSNSAADAELPLTTTTYYHGDQIGSARMLTAAEGWPVWSQTYYPFGLDASSASEVNHYRYTDLEEDNETGFDHAMFRQYAPVMGRWMSPDPYDGSYDLTNPQSFNRYAYAMNNPLSAIDPLGLDASCGRDGGLCGSGGDGPDCNDDYTVCVTAPTDPTDCSDPNVVCLPAAPGPTGPGLQPRNGPGGGYGKAPNSGMTAAQFFECASKTANKFSIAGFAGLTSPGGSVGAQAGKAIGTAFLGNTFSGISDMFTHVGTGNFGAAYGDFALGGTAQGLPLGTSASAQGIVGVSTDAAVGATLGAEMIEPVGWAKLGIDAVVYLGSMVSCAP